MAANKTYMRVTKTTSRQFQQLQYPEQQPVYASFQVNPDLAGGSVWAYMGVSEKEGNTETIPFHIKMRVAGSAEEKTWNLCSGEPSSVLQEGDASSGKGVNKASNLLIVRMYGKTVELWANPDLTSDSDKNGTPDFVEAPGAADAVIQTERGFRFNIVFYGHTQTSGSNVYGIRLGYDMNSVTVGDGAVFGTPAQYTPVLEKPVFLDSEGNQFWNLTGETAVTVKTAVHYDRNLPARSVTLCAVAYDKDNNLRKVRLKNVEDIRELAENEIMALIDIDSQVFKLKAFLWCDTQNCIPVEDS